MLLCFRKYYRIAWLISVVVFALGCSQFKGPEVSQDIFSDTLASVTEIRSVDPDFAHHLYNYTMEDVSFGQVVSLSSAKDGKTIEAIVVKHNFKDYAEFSRYSAKLIGGMRVLQDAAYYDHMKKEKEEPLVTAPEGAEAIASQQVEKLKEEMAKRGVKENEIQSPRDRFPDPELLKLLEGKQSEVWLAYTGQEMEPPRLRTELKMPASLEAQGAIDRSGK